MKNLITSEKDASLGISRMPLRKLRIKEERLIEDADSDEEADAEEKDLFDDFVIIDKDEASKIDQYLKKFNKPELLEEEEKKKDNGRSVLLFSKKFKPDQD